MKEIGELYGGLSCFVFRLAQSQAPAALDDIFNGAAGDLSNEASRFHGLRFAEGLSCEGPSLPFLVSRPCQSGVPGDGCRKA